jgi:hypothetical protein
MIAWEFTYVGLYLGHSEDEIVQRAQERIAALGRDGWEPVGQVNFVYVKPGAGRETSVDQLMFKRPARDPS